MAAKPKKGGGLSATERAERSGAIRRAFPPLGGPRRTRPFQPRTVA